MPKLTKRLIDSLKPREREYTVWDSEIPGFGARVWPSGRIVYILKYRVGGGRGGTIRKPTIGVHGAITADKARTVAKNWHSQVADGGDPSLDREKVRDMPTVEALCDRYLAEHAEPYKRPSSVAEDRRLIEKCILPAFGRRKIDSLSRADTARLHARMRSTPVTANRTLALISKMMNLAEAWGYRPDGSNPCRHVAKYRERKRERLLSTDELAAIGEALTATERDGSESIYAVAALRLLLFTGARRGEILGLRWEDVDFDAACLRLSESKTGAKVIHLPAPALEILSTLPHKDKNPFVIASRKPGTHLVNLAKPWGHIRDRASVILWSRNEDARGSGLIADLAERLDRAPTAAEALAEAEQHKIDLPIGLRDVRIHDLRHAFASVAASAGLGLPLIGKMLGHAQAQTTARYAHLAADPVRAAVEAVAGTIAAAMKGQGAEVLALPRAKR